MVFIYKVGPKHSKKTGKKVQRTVYYRLVHYKRMDGTVGTRELRCDSKGKIGTKSKIWHVKPNTEGYDIEGVEKAEGPVYNLDAAVEEWHRKGRVKPSERSAHDTIKAMSVAKQIAANTNAPKKEEAPKHDPTEDDEFWNLDSSDDEAPSKKKKGGSKK